MSNKNQNEKTRVMINALTRMGLTNKRMVNKEIISRVQDYNRISKKLSPKGFKKSDIIFFDKYINQGNNALTKNKNQRQRIYNVFSNLMILIRDSNNHGHNLVNNFYSSYVSNYKNVVPEMIYKDELIEYLREAYKLLKPHAYNNTDQEFKPTIHKLIPQSYTLLDIQSDKNALKVLKERTKLMKDIRKIARDWYELEHDDVIMAGTLYEIVKHITRTKKLNSKYNFYNRVNSNSNNNNNNNNNRNNNN